MYMEKYEKGDSRGYTLSLLILILSISILLLAYDKLNPIFMEIWGAQNGWYLDEYRTWGAKIWRMLFRANYSWIFLLLPCMWGFSTFLLQSVLKRNHAKIFNKCHSGLIVVLSAFALSSFGTLMLRPLL